MNVLFVQPALPLYRAPFFERLEQDEAWSVTVWSDHGSQLHANSPHGFTAAHRPEIHVGGLVYQPAFMEAVRAQWADVVVLTWNTRYVHLLPALLEARARRKPVVLWGHGYSKNEQWVTKRWRNALGRLATACVTYSETTRTQLLTQGFAPDRTFAAPNALHDGPQYAPNAKAASAGRGGDPAQAARRVHGVLFVSRVEPDKRPSLLIDAFARVRAEVPDAHLTVVGTGSELGAVRRRVHSLHLDETVTFAGAIYDETALAPLFHNSAVLAYPAAIGLSLLHAFSYGLPVVTSAQPERHNPEFEAFVPEVNGLTYRDEDVEDFARQIVRVLQDSALRARLSQGALAAVSPPRGKTLTAMVQGMAEALRYAARSSVV